jgi:hypothetical protein
LNVELFRDSYKLKLGVFGVDRKLVQDAVYLWRYNFEKEKNSSSYMLPEQQPLLGSRNLGVL